MEHSSPIDETTYREYLQHLLQGDVHHCRALVQGLLEQGIPLATIYEDLLGRALHETGDKWACSEISVAVEHLASMQTEDVMRMVYPLAPRSPAVGRKAIVTCTAKELHHIGARMVSDLLDRQGWDVAFLGGNTPPDSLLGLVDHLRPDLLGLSVTMPENLPEFHQTLAAASREFPNLRIVVGGQAFRLAGHAGEPVLPGATYLGSASRIEQELG